MVSAMQCLLQCWEQGKVLVTDPRRGDSDTNSGLVHSKDAALVHQEGHGHILPCVCEVQ